MKSTINKNGRSAINKLSAVHKTSRQHYHLEITLLLLSNSYQVKRIRFLPNRWLGIIYFAIHAKTEGVLCNQNSFQLESSQTILSGSQNAARNVDFTSTQAADKMR